MKEGPSRAAQDLGGASPSQLYLKAAVDAVDVLRAVGNDVLRVDPLSKHLNCPRGHLNVLGRQGSGKTKEVGQGKGSKTKPRGSPAP